MSNYMLKKGVKLDHHPVRNLLETIHVAWEDGSRYVVKIKEQSEIPADVANAVQRSKTVRAQSEPSIFFSTLQKQIFTLFCEEI